MDHRSQPPGRATDVDRCRNDRVVRRESGSRGADRSRCVLLHAASRRVRSAFGWSDDRGFVPRSTHDTAVGAAAPARLACGHDADAGDRYGSEGFATVDLDRGLLHPAIRVHETRLRRCLRLAFRAGRQGSRDTGQPVRVRHSRADIGPAACPARSRANGADARGLGNDVLSRWHAVVVGDRARRGRARRYRGRIRTPSPRSGAHQSLHYGGGRQLPGRHRHRGDRRGGVARQGPGRRHGEGRATR